MQLKNLRDTAAALLSLDVDDEIDQIADFTLDGFIGHIHIRPQRQSGQARERLQSGIRVNGRDGPGMSGV